MVQAFSSSLRERQRLRTPVSRTPDLLKLCHKKNCYDSFCFVA